MFSISISPHDFERACHDNDVDTVKRYISQNNNNKFAFNITDSYGFTPFLSAARGGHSDIMKLLIDTAWINVNASSSWGGTALHLAASNGKYEAVQLLLNYGGFNLFARDTANKTAADCAHDNGYDDIANLIIKSQKEYMNDDDFVVRMKFNKYANK